MRVLSIFLLTLLTGCGAGLTPAQKTEYDELGQRASALNAELAATEAAGSRAYQKLGAAEKRAKATTKRALACGVSLKGQAIGPLPFRHKPKYSVRFVAGKKRVVGKQTCVEYKLKVTK